MDLPAARGEGGSTTIVPRPFDVLGTKAMSTRIFHLIWTRGPNRASR